MRGGDLREYERKIVENVREYGCHVISVFDPEGSEPSFSYSVGFLETVNQPEAIVFGLSTDMMHVMLNDLLDQCREGLVLSDWVEVKGLLEGHRCILREVRPDCIVPEYMNSAIWFHNRRTGEPLTEAVQIIWPGAADGLFPWEDGCNERVRELQPPLYERELNS